MISCTASSGVACPRCAGGLATAPCTFAVGGHFVEEAARKPNPGDFDLDLVRVADLYRGGLGWPRMPAALFST